MQFTAQEISLLLDGTVDGDPNVLVNQLAKIEEAENGSLSFLANPKYEQYLYTTNASVVIVNKDLVLTDSVKSTLVRVENAYTAFTILLEKYNTIKMNKTGIETPSFIHPSAKIGKNAYIGAFAYIGPNVTIGDNCKIFPNTYIADDVTVGNNAIFYAGVKVYFDCHIGNNVIIHSGTVIGGDGFGFAPQPDGTYTKVAQIGNVILEDDVEVGANTTIDRATLGSTIIRKGVKLDNLIQIAHNVEIGSNTVIAAQSGVSGSTKLGKNVMVCGQVGIVGHIQIADGSKINAQSGVTKSLKMPNSAVTGSPAFEYTSAL